MNKILKNVITPLLFAGMGSVYAQSAQSIDATTNLDNLELNLHSDYKNLDLDDSVLSFESSIDSIADDSHIVRKPRKMGKYSDDYATYGSFKVFGYDGSEVSNAKITVIPKGYVYASQSLEVSKDEPIAKYFVPSGVSTKIMVVPTGNSAKKYDSLILNEVLTGGNREFYLPADK